MEAVPSAGPGKADVGGQDGRPKPDPGLWQKAQVERLRFRQAPLLGALVCFALGVLGQRLGWRPEGLLLGLTGLMVLLCCWALRRGFGVVLAPVLGLWMVVGWWCAEVRPVPDPQTALLGYADNLSREVRGRVVRVRELPPRTGAQDKDSDGWKGLEDEEASEVGALQVDLAVEQVEYLTPDVSEMVPIAGGVRATLIADNGVLPTIGCGDRLEAPMRMREPERYRDPGAWQYADYLLTQGMAVHASVHGGKVRVLNTGGGPQQVLRFARAGNPARMGAVEAWGQRLVMPGEWGCLVQGVQGWAAGRVRGYVRSRVNLETPAKVRMTPNDAAMLNAMLFGDRTGLNHELRLGFERTGSFHLFVVSGMHVALVAGGIFWLSRRLRAGEVVAALVTISLTFGYAVLTGFGAPVQRALWMTTIFLVARLLSRERSVLNALGAAALGILVWSPAALFEASFQMTFLAILAIAGIAVPLADRSLLRYARAARGLEEIWRDARMEPRMAQMRVMLRMWGEAVAGVMGDWSRGLPGVAVRVGLAGLELAWVGVVAEMVMVLPMAAYFHRATVFALPANMVSVPVVGVLVPVAVVTFACLLVSPWLAAVPGALTAVLLHGVTGAIGRISQVAAADVRIPGPAWWVVVIAVAVWAMCCWAVRRSDRCAVIAAVAMPLIALLVLWPERPAETPKSMEVTAIDVGQGDSLLVVGGDGRTMLVDAGGPVGGVDEAAQATANFDVGEEVVSSYLWSRRLRRLDVVTLSHAHSDHMGGMPAVLRNFRPRELWVGVDADTDAYRALLAEAAELGVCVRRFRAGERFGWGTQEVEVLAPSAGYLNGGAPKNDDSLVLRVDYGHGSVLLEGDAEAPSERAMIKDRRVRPVTLLKVGHHGSRSSTTEAFLREAAPKVAVISVGKGNTFGHPRGDVIARIQGEGARMYRTDEFGLTTFLIEQNGGVTEVTPTE